MPADPSSSFNPNHAARLLHEDVMVKRPGALKRARVVFSDLVGIPDDDVPAKVGLQRCQRIIAKERGAADWASLPKQVESPSLHRRWDGEKGTYSEFKYQLVAVPGEIFDALRKAADRLPVHALVCLMIYDMLDPSKGRGVGTEEQCREVLAWAKTIHPRGGEVLKMDYIWSDADDDGGGDIEYGNAIMDILDP